MSLKDEKARLRQTLAGRLAALSPARRRAAAEALVDALHLEGLTRVALFASLPRELDTGPLDARLRARGIERALPRVDGRDLRFHLVPPGQAAAELPRGNFRVPEPDPAWPEVALSSCGLIVVPGLAFDDEGRRLGYGAGFYDRALAGRPARTVGVGFAEQRVDRVPAGPEDVPLDEVVLV